MLGLLLEFVASIMAAVLVIGALIFIVRLVAPGPEHWNRKWGKYYTTDEEREKAEKHDRSERWKKL